MSYVETIPGCPTERDWDISRKRKEFFDGLRNALKAGITACHAAKQNYEDGGN